MPLKHLIFRRISTIHYPFRFNHPSKGFCITNHFFSANHDTMAQESKNKDIDPGKVNPMTLNISKTREEKQKATEESTPAIPLPPPEKPLPGDCCDSGCVRCVWDGYYEELEEYNKLYKSDSKTS